MLNNSVIPGFILLVKFAAVFTVAIRLLAYLHGLRPAGTALTCVLGNNSLGQGCVSGAFSLKRVHNKYTIIHAGALERIIVSCFPSSALYSLTRTILAATVPDTSVQDTHTSAVHSPRPGAEAASRTAHPRGCSTCGAA